jgi:hypothetical protein
MNIKPVYLLTIFAVFVSACTTIPTDDIKVDAEVDQKARISGYKTYAWLGSAAIVNDPAGKWEPLSFDADAEITFLLDRELRKRGMTESESNPDLLVAYAAGIDMAALGVKEDPKSNINILENTPKGGLIVLLIDSDTGFIVWAGVATANVQFNDSATIKARLDYAINKMMKLLPK